MCNHSRSHGNSDGEDSPPGSWGPINAPTKGLPQVLTRVRKYTRECPQSWFSLCYNPIDRLPRECSRECSRGCPRKCTRSGLVVCHLVCFHLLCSLPTKNASEKQSQFSVSCVANQIKAEELLQSPLVNEQRLCCDFRVVILIACKSGSRSAILLRSSIILTAEFPSICDCDFGAHGTGCCKVGAAPSVDPAARTWMTQDESKGTAMSSSMHMGMN